MKQKSFFKPTNRQHGGIWSIGARRSRRPMNMKTPLHITLRSELAHGQRSLMKHKNLVRRVMRKAANRFRVKVCEYAICGNHLHFLVKANFRIDIQNFFRVLAGHIAQGILAVHPLTQKERGGAPGNLTAARKGCAKNQRKFWALLLYSTIVRWGRDFRNVVNYIWQNNLEALFIIPYRPRKKPYQGPS
jgi:REP element-mobilizing transposase RayT